MGLESVIDDIRNRGQREAAAIRSEAQDQADQILDQARRRVEEMKLAAEQEVQVRIAKMMDQEISAANLIVKRQVLNAQKEVLDQAYRETLAALSRLPEQTHRDVVKRLLLQVAEEIRQGVVYCNRRDMPAVRDLIAQNDLLAGYRMGDPVDIEGGIIVESDDGDVKIDLCYRTILDGMWESGLKDVFDILFA